MNKNCIEYMVKSKLDVYHCEIKSEYCEITKQWRTRLTVTNGEDRDNRLILNCHDHSWRAANDIPIPEPDAYVHLYSYIGNAYSAPMDSFTTKCVPIRNLVKYYKKNQIWKQEPTNEMKEDIFEILSDRKPMKSKYYEFSNYDY